MSFWNRLWALARRERLDRELDDEVRSHIDLATEDYVRRGMPPAEARRQARVKFGAVDACKEAHRDSRGVAWLDGLLYDTRFAFRALKREPGFAATAVLMLALAAGLNMTAFRVLDTMLFRGIPLVRDNARMLYMEERFPTGGCCVSYFAFQHWRKEARSFQDIGFMVPKNVSLREGDSDGRNLWVVALSSNSFGLVGARPFLGRDFQPSDEQPGAPPVAIANYQYWRTRLGGKRDVIGGTVRINGVPTTIIGVMPDGFTFPQNDDIWLPLEQNAELQRRVPNGGAAYGRLAPGATEAGARTELETINKRLELEYPETNRDVRPIVTSFRNATAGRDGALIYGSLWLGAGFVLWIACANLANLALARVQGRARELSTRMALGAGRARVIRQLFLENLMIAVAAGLAAWWISAAATRTWAVSTQSNFQNYDYSANWGTYMYLPAIMLGAALVITLVPMGQVWRLDVNGALKGESRGATMSLSAKHLSAALVALQMALAIVLMAGAGVLGRSLWNILAARVGVKEPGNVLVGRLVLPRERYGAPELRAAFFDTLQARLGAVPGVEMAGVSNARPVDDHEPLAIEPEGEMGARHVTPRYMASPGYFRTIGAGILKGRDFSSADRLGAPLVAVVNQRFADAYFPGRSPLGQRIRIYEKRETEPGEWRTIVGVVSNIMQNEPTRQRFVPVVYQPYAQLPVGTAWFFARMRNVSDGMASVLREEVRRLDPRLEIVDFSTLEGSLGFEPNRMFAHRDLAKHAAVAPIYASLALLLAAIGLYAVVARSVGRRTKEIGVRMALGAEARAIQRLVLVEGMTPVVVGLVLGLAASLGVNRLLQTQLVGVSPYDLPTLTLAPLILTLVALLGCLFPVRQAVKVDPVEALRHD